jgi:TRAP-type C4-dicarboxylate transport system substrate-binding protein
MNRARYERLPPELQRAVDDVSGTALVERFGAWWKAWEEPGIAAALARNHTVTHLTEGERDRWRRAVQPVIDDRLGELAATGVDAQAIYRAAQRYLALGA